MFQIVILRLSLSQSFTRVQYIFLIKIPYNIFYLSLHNKYMYNTILYVQYPKVHSNPDNLLFLYLLIFTHKVLPSSYGAPSTSGSLPLREERRSAFNDTARELSYFSFFNSYVVVFYTILH